MTNITVFETDLQNRIAKMLTDGIDPLRIAEVCECSDSTVYDVKNSAKMAQICYNSAMQELFSVGAKVAVDTLIEIARDKTAAKQARVTASDKILSYTGFHISETGKLDKSPSTMTQEELQQRLIALQNEASQRAKPVVVIESDSPQDGVDEFNNLLD